MPLHSRENQYRGINAHFHSDLQNDSDAWGVFHSMYIANLAVEIDALLPPGYIAEPERGLQIKPYHPVTGEAYWQRTHKTPKTGYFDLCIANNQPKLSIFRRNQCANTGTTRH